jgi:hypothetical protein
VKRVVSVLLVGMVLVLSAGCGGDKAEFPSDTKTLMPTMPEKRVEAPTVPPFKK